MKFYVVIDSTDGEVYKKVFDKQIWAFNAVTIFNKEKYDTAYGKGGWGVVAVNTSPNTPPEEIIAMAKRIQSDKGVKMENKVVTNLLGNDEIAEYTKESSNGMSQERLDEIYNTYYQGNTEDFKSSFKAISEVAQFLTYIIEIGTDLREVQKMVRVLS